MLEFAGFQMPMSYRGVKIEHHNVRNNVGVFDVSHMGQFIVRGPKSGEFLEAVTTNNVAKLEKGQAQYTCMTNENGGIIDDLLLYHLLDGAYMLVVNASNIEKDLNWLKQHKESDEIELIDISAKTAMLAVQGPNALQVLAPHTDMDLENMSYYHFDKGIFAGQDKVLVSATGYTGAGGFELYFASSKSETIWNAIWESDEKWGLQAAGLAARDTLRLEKAYCLYGNDIDESTSPLEAGLAWITDLKTDFIGREMLLKQKSSGVARRLVGLELLEKGIARKGYEVLDESGQVLGQVTSGTMSPSLNKAIALAYVNKPYSRVDSRVWVQIRNKRVPAKVVKRPFVS